MVVGLLVVDNDLDSFDQYLIVKPDGDLLEGMQTVFVYYEAYKRYIYA